MMPRPTLLFYEGGMPYILRLNLFYIMLCYIGILIETYFTGCHISL